MAIFKKGVFIIIKKVGIIRVITTDDDFILYSHEKKLQTFLPDLKFITKAIPDQPFGVYDKKTENEAVPKILKMASQMEKNGVNAILISCCSDPGLKEVKNAVSIPVIGAGQGAAVLAKVIGTKIGVISITEKLPENLKNYLGKHFLNYYRPEGVQNTLDLLTKEGKESILKSAKRLLEEGADCILLGCTGMATIGIANFIEEKLDIKVIDPIVASGSLLNYLVNRLDWQRR